MKKILLFAICSMTFAISNCGIKRATAASQEADQKGTLALDGQKTPGLSACEIARNKKLAECGPNDWRCHAAAWVWFQFCVNPRPKPTKSPGTKSPANQPEKPGDLIEVIDGCIRSLWQTRTATPNSDTANSQDAKNEIKAACHRAVLEQASPSQQDH